jgi:shikimate kinase
MGMTGQMLVNIEKIDHKQNIVLIGMPGVGKTTLGKRLAACLKRLFLDTDDVIESRQGRSLQEIIELRGRRGFYRAEEEAVLSVDCRSHVIATGGSVVYSPMAIDHLKQLGIIVYLDISLSELKKRLTNFDSRGILKSPGQSLDDLFDERRPLYLNSAQLKVSCSRKSQQEVIRAIITGLNAL